MSAINNYLSLVSSMDAAASVKVMATSDIHTSGMDDIEAKGCTVVVFAGDIMGAGMDSDEAGERYLEREFFPWCEKNAQREIVVIPGNHDKYLFRMWHGGKNIAWPKNVHYLVDAGCTVNGVRFYGTPWCTKDREERFEADDRTLAERFAKIPRGVDVLVSHTPPYIAGSKIDYSDHAGCHEGSCELTDAILRSRPKFCVCGHIHGGTRKPEMLGETTVVNVARVKSDRSEAACRPTVITVPLG